MNAGESGKHDWPSFKVRMHPPLRTSPVVSLLCGLLLLEVHCNGLPRTFSLPLLLLPLHAHRERY